MFFIYFPYLYLLNFSLSLSRSIDYYYYSQIFHQISFKTVVWLFFIRSFSVALYRKEVTSMNRMMLMTVSIQIIGMELEVIFLLCPFSDIIDISISHKL